MCCELSGQAYCFSCDMRFWPCKLQINNKFSANFPILCVSSIFCVCLMVLRFLSGGGAVAYADARSDPSSEYTTTEAAGHKKKLVVLGTGWAGTSFLKNLDTSLYDVKVVSPRNYFAFTPLLPSVTCGTVEPRSIVEPIRNIMKKV